MRRTKPHEVPAGWQVELEPVASIDRSRQLGSGLRPECEGLLGRTVRWRLHDDKDGIDVDQEARDRARELRARQLTRDMNESSCNNVDRRARIVGPDQSAGSAVVARRENEATGVSTR